MSEEIEKVAEEVSSEVLDSNKVASESKESSQTRSSEEVLDWDALEKVEESKAETKQMYLDTLGSVSEKEIIDGTVVRLTDKEAIVDIGYKSEGVISLNEFRSDHDLKVGDIMEVLIQKQEDKLGQLVLSHKKAKVLKSWRKINKAFEDGEILQGHIKCRTNGGMIVEIFGLETFLPGSQIDVNPIKDYDQYVNKEMEFKVVKINHRFNNVVVSHKALIESDIAEQKKEMIAQLEKGQLLEGVVKNITSYGVFVDLGGVDGLVHITDLSWSRVSHPSEVVELNQKLNVVILDFDKEKTRIQLGLKQLEEHPWEKLDESLKVGSRIKGKVTVLSDYGAFVEVVKGIEGLLHVSEMSWSTHLRSAQDFLKVGDEIEVQILTLDKENRKMSLGIKQLTPDPWNNIVEKYPIGTIHNGVVKNLTNFGAFVELEDGIEGLVYISDFSWVKRFKHPSDFIKAESTLEVKVMEIDVDARKLNLSHKHTKKNPWDEEYEKTYTLGSVHTFTVREIFDKGALVELPEGINGFIPSRHLVKEDGKSIKRGETAKFKVIEMNKEFQKLIFSHTATFKNTDNNANYPNKMATKVEKTRLGDLGALSKLKSGTEKSDKKE